MLVQTRLQAQQHKKTLPLTSEKMTEETNNRHAIDETQQLIKKALLDNKLKCSPSSMIFSHDSPRHREDL